MYQTLDDNYYNEKYLVQTRSQAKSSGTKLLEVHGVTKNLDPNLKPEKQPAMPKKWKYGKALHRSRKSWIKKKKT